MVTIGYLHYRKRPEKLNKAYAFAAVAKAEGAELLYFSPSAVDFEKRKIRGYIYMDGKWVKIISDFPDVVYNSVGFSTERQDDIVDRLMDLIPFTSYSIGNKMTVFNNLVKYGKFLDYLIPTENIISVKHFFDFIDKYTKIVIKPSIGCQGIDVYYIEKLNNTYQILLASQVLHLNLKEATDFIVDKINTQAYIAQPYINSRTKTGDSFDIRLHMQKNSKGDWVSAKIYPRISVTGSIVCNIHSGGYTADPKTFFRREFGDDYFDIRLQIEDFGLKLAAHMDKIQKELYNEKLDELGIDIGLDENRKIYIYEINWRPGYPPSMSADLGVIKNLVHYSIFLVTGERGNMQ